MRVEAPLPDSASVTRPARSGVSGGAAARMSALRIGRQRRVDTKTRKRRHVENEAFRLMLGRLLRALGRRVAEGDSEDLALLASLSREADELLAQAIAGQRAAGDVSWQRIADALGVTRQAAQQRFKRRTVEGRAMR